MKKLIFLIFIIGIVILTGCQPLKYYFKYDDLIEIVNSVEYIYYHCDESKILTMDSDTILYCDLEKLEVIEILDEELLPIFLKELSEVAFHASNSSSEEPVGRGIRLMLKNDDFIILASCGEKNCGIVAEFDERGRFIKYFASFLSGGDNWIQKYFEI